jgi:hypothetical protein
MSDRHSIIATPKDRWYLARFLLRDGLTFNGRKDQKILARVKRALHLDAPMNMMLSKSGTFPQANDLTPSLYEGTAEMREFFERCINSIEKPPMTAAETANLDPVLEQLEDAACAAEVVAESPDAKPLDPKAEDWTPSNSPILTNPARFVEVVCELIRRHRPDPRTEPAWAAFCDAFLEESEPPKPEKKTGRLHPSAEQAAPS